MGAQEKMKTNILFGPPGTGKTTKMLSLVEMEVQRGVRPEQIGFVSFTKKAAREAKERAMVKFNLTDDQLPHYRTLHSTAFRCIGMNTKQLMKPSDFKRIGWELGLPVTNPGYNDDQIVFGSELGDRIFFMIQLARSKKVSLRELWEDWPDEDIIWGELERAAKFVIEYKQNHLLKDFTDIIQEFIQKKCPPPLSVLFVDEAQDLKNLEWDMVEVLAENVERVYIAGDDDQAIYRWAGADVEHFINLQGDKQVLGQSYRVPSSVAEVAHDIINRVSVRHPKTWLPRAEKGMVNYLTPDDEIDMSDGSWLVLARNKHLLTPYHEQCNRQGYSFESMLGSPIRPTALESIRLWEELRKGNPLLPSQVMKVYDSMSNNKGFARGNKVKLERCPQEAKLTISDLKKDFGLLKEDIWHESLDRISIEEKEYVLAARRRGESLSAKPRIKISTIHGAKGGEADNVLLLTDMAPRTYRESLNNPDDEARVWYVAATRAKHTLNIMQPSSQYFYEL